MADQFMYNIGEKVLLPAGSFGPLAALNAFMKPENNISAANGDEKFIQALLSLHAYLIATNETEYKRLASYLNDTIIQVLSALHIRLSLLTNEVPDQAQSQFADTLNMIVDLTEEVAATAQELRPLELDTLGLHAALHQVCEEFYLPVTYEGSDLPHLPEAAALTFYRLAQEALANILHHAQATRVWVKLQANGELATLTIRDNGHGFAYKDEITHPTEAPGQRLFSLMLRFQQLNGRLTIRSILGQGTRITGYLPLLSSN